MVGDVLPSPSVTDAEYVQLELSEFELLEFQKRKPLWKFLLDSSKPLPTAVHSWGNQVLSCPCHCRLAPFAPTRLDRGICAVLVKGKSCLLTGAPNYRHLSAREVALLCCLSPLAWFGEMPRLALALVGQLASPLQSAWVGSHLARALQRMGLSCLCKNDPGILLDHQICELLAQVEMAGLRPPTVVRGPSATQEAMRPLQAFGEEEDQGFQLCLPAKRKPVDSQGERDSEVADTLSDPLSDTEYCSRPPPWQALRC